jgi:hypothetical protein
MCVYQENEVGADEWYHKRKKIDLREIEGQLKTEILFF